MIWDVIVVGGGPAGAGAATWLARAGFQVCLLDRARFPRDKACGEYLTRQAKTLLEALGVWEAVCAEGAHAVSATVLVAPSGVEMRHQRVDGLPTGYAVRRIVLDRILLENARHAGVHVQEQFSVRSLQRENNGRVPGIRGTNAQGEQVSLQSRLVIAADGSHSLVARQLALVRPVPRLQRLAVVSHWQNVSGPQDAIEMRAVGPVVCGLGALSDSSNLTLDVPTTFAKQISGRAKEFVAETVEKQFPDLAERLRGAVCEPSVRTIGCFGHFSRSPFADGALLVGDAATFIDPFTGEGVYFALRGAQLAAETGIRALHAGDTSPARLASYADARRELNRRYLLCDLIQAVARRPRLLNALVHRFRRVPAVADHLLAILSDTRPVTDALHPNFLWQLLAPEI